ncbi:MAG: T9SS type A sorting domain-containing protein [Bacteroidales bacterium]|jgi:hypothetical protein|nr:T9SS type A sorting domain-containing protein [Bacteroidales bacterium]
MKKIILLFTAMICFLTIEAQTITKLLGNISTRASSLVNLETDTIRYTGAIHNLALCFGFEFKNGQTPLVTGDTVIIKCYMNNSSTGMFPDSIYVLKNNLATEASVEFKFPISESMSEYLNILDSYIVNDSTHNPDICGVLTYVSNYPPITNSQKCAKAILVKTTPSGSGGEDTTAITESVMAKVKLYPNPVSDNLHITNLKNTNVEVYNVVGQRVSYFENVSNDLSINMRTFPEGIYFVKLQNGKAVRTEKIKLVK